jgi:LytS/YehU family sensor histidine kinase
MVRSTYYGPVFLGWSLGYFWIAAALAARSAEQRADAAELEALRAEVQRLRGQLDPHFLFNALNGIGAEIPDQPETARRMLEELADYLRLCLDNRDRAVTTVAAELETLEAYMAIERARLGSGVGFAVAAEPAARARAMPAFLLQPLVENAIKHGRRQGLVPSIRVEARAEGAWLHLAVRNNGRLAADWQAQGDPGVGLANLRQRLALHFPGRHEFTLSQEQGGVAARIALRGEPAGA